MSRSVFPDFKPGRYYLTEGGIETEIMYKWGFELPEFAMFPLLENLDARQAIAAMYRRYLDVVAQYGHCALIGGFDYRASPDWGRKLGYSAAALKDANLASIQFLRDVTKPYQSEIAAMLLTGYVGPRGDAYGYDQGMNIQQAEEYHGVQLATLKEAGVDLVWAVTFNNPIEAIGVVLAAKRLDLPIAVSFSLNRHHRLSSGVQLSEAVNIVDAATDQYPDFYSLNCSHPDEFEPALEDSPWMQRIRCIRPNAAKMDKIALCKLGRLEEGDPIELGHLMFDIGRRYPQLDIWGGCCGTGHVHLEEIARHLPVKAA